MGWEWTWYFKGDFLSLFPDLLPKHSIVLQIRLTNKNILRSPNDDVRDMFVLSVAFLNKWESKQDYYCHVNTVEPCTVFHTIKPVHQINLIPWNVSYWINLTQWSVSKKVDIYILFFYFP